MVKATGLFQVLFYFLFLTTSAHALSYSYTTVVGDDGPGAGISYTLTVNPLGGSDYSAIFTVDPTASTLTDYWTSGWFLFKLGDSIKATLSSLISPPGTGTWKLADSTQNSDVEVAMGGGNYNTLLHDGFSGIYNEGFSDPPGGGVNLTSGILLTLGGTAQSFSFNFSTLGFPIPISFQVGYYDGLAGRSGNYIFNQLSETLAQSLDAPSSLVLLGIGLLGLFWVSRKIDSKSA